MPRKLEIVRSDSRGRPAVVAPPHPLYGGRLDNPVDARVDVLPDADHFFANPLWLEKLGDLVRAQLS